MGGLRATSSGTVSRAAEVQALALCVLLLAGLAGCAGDTESLSCPYPAGTSCESLSDVYERTSQKAAPGAADEGAAPSGDGDGGGKSAVQRESALLVLPGGRRPGREHNDPVLEPPQVLRVWMAPWQDEDGDLRGAQYLHLVLKPPSWRINVAAPVSPKPRPAGRQQE